MDKIETSIEAFKNLAKALGAFASETHRAATATGLPPDLAKELTMQASMALVKSVFSALMEGVVTQQSATKQGDATSALFEAVLKNLNTGKGS